MPSWRLHQLEAAVDLVERDAVRDQRSTSISPASQRSTSSGTWRAALTPPNERAGDAAAGDQQARQHLEHLALAGDAAHRREAPCLARGLDRLLHHRDVAGRLEGVVGAEAARLGADPVDGVVAREARVGGAVVARLREPFLREVDRDDPPRAREPRADHRAEADEAAAEDGARRARLTSAV